MSFQNRYLVEDTAPNATNTGIETGTHTPTNLDNLLSNTQSQDISTVDNNMSTLGGAESQPEVQSRSGITDNFNPNQDTAVETVNDLVKHQGFFDRYEAILN